MNDFFALWEAAHDIVYWFVRFTTSKADTQLFKNDSQTIEYGTQSISHGKFCKGKFHLNLVAMNSGFHHI